MDSGSTENLVNMCKGATMEKWIKLRKEMYGEKPIEYPVKFVNLCYECGKPIDDCDYAVLCKDCDDDKSR